MFERLGRTCHAPDLIGHGKRAADAAKTLVGVGMADYRAELEALLETLPPKPVMLGHSMGGVLAQQLAAEGLASALILIAPAPRAGILPPTDAEKQLDQDLMGLGAFWKTVINPDFDLARIYTLNRVPEAEQRVVFDKFGPESGRAFFELFFFFWMLDESGATVVDTAASNARCYAWSERTIDRLAADCAQMDVRSDAEQRWSTPLPSNARCYAWSERTTRSSRRRPRAKHCGWLSRRNVLGA